MTAANEAQRFAPAKINLFLHVGDRRADGYHNLLSLIAFADVGDRISVKPAKQTSFRLAGPFSAALEGDPDNLVLQAERALVEWAIERNLQTQPVEITLEKNLPVASGVGGGSADAAATLLLLSSYWSLPIGVDDLAKIGLALGADVPVCLRSSPTMVSGVGEILAPVDNLPRFSFVLANPRVEVPTSQVFKALSVRSGAAVYTSFANFATARDLAMVLDRLTNDLAPPAKAMAPVIMKVESALAQTTNCLIARMSGSGATCYGLYESDADAAVAAETIARAHPEWWVKATRSYVPRD